MGNKLKSLEFFGFTAKIYQKVTSIYTEDGMDCLIELKNLTKHFDAIKAVDDVSFKVRRGEVLGFLGPNGAGKSTTMKMATGFLLPTSGHAKIMGYDVIDKPIEARRNMGYLPEGAPAYGDMTPYSFLKFVAEARGIKAKDIAKSIQNVVDKTHIGGVIHQTIETLSKGFKRRVGLAQALIHNPDVLILDEPTDGLDPNQKYEVRKLIHEMAKDKAIIISTHILEEVEAVCTRAIIISEGKLTADETPDELKARSERHNAIYVSVKNDSATLARTTFMQFDTVKRVEKAFENGTHVEYIIIPKKGFNLLDQVSTIVRERGWAAGELRVERGQLDDVFRQITAKNLS